MSASKAQISFAELLAANESETRRWRQWFEKQPTSVLDVPLSIALAKNVREFVLHIFAVELRYAERLTGPPVTDYQNLSTLSVADLFATGDRARGIYRDYLGTATDEDLAIVMEFPYPYCRHHPCQQAQDVHTRIAPQRAPLGAVGHRPARGGIRDRLGQRLLVQRSYEVVRSRSSSGEAATRFNRSAGATNPLIAKLRLVLCSLTTRRDDLPHP